MMNSSIEKFNKLAVRLKKNLSELKQPVIVEFSGTPKSGKTTCLEAISKYLRRNEISTIIIPEQSTFCPISNKLDIRFNIWTGTQSLDQLLGSIERRPSVIILDRGIFDTLVWLKLLHKKKEISDKEFETAKSFFLLETWTTKINLVVVISVEAEEALHREFKDSITMLSGRIMNKTTLEDYNICLQESTKEFHNFFRNIKVLDTTKIETSKGVADIANEVITLIDRLVDENIAVIEKNIVKTIFEQSRVIIEIDRINRIITKLKNHICWKKRTEIESEVHYVQIVPVAVFRFNNKIVVFAVRGKKQGEILQNKTSIWLGGHVRETDRSTRGRVSTTFRRTLCREIEEELKDQIKINISDIPNIPKAIVWDPTQAKSIQHLALFYEIQLSEKHMVSLNSREYWEDLEKSLFTQIMDLDETLLKQPNWENWSLLYLKYIEGLDVKFGDIQRMVY